MQVEKDFIESQKYLPQILKNDKDKEIFKMISLFYSDTNKLADIDWPIARSYVIKNFLAFMACHGYVLSKVDERASNMEFCDLDETKRQYNSMVKLELEELWRLLDKWPRIPNKEETEE